MLTGPPPKFHGTWDILKPPTTPIQWLICSPGSAILNGPTLTA